MPNIDQILQNQQNIRLSITIPMKADVFQARGLEYRQQLLKNYLREKANESKVKRI